MADLSPALIEELAKGLMEFSTGYEHPHEWFMPQVEALAPILSRALTEAAKAGAENGWREGYVEGHDHALYTDGTRPHPVNPYLTKKEQSNGSDN